MKKNNNKKPNAKRIIFLGILCLAFAVLSSVYAVLFNDARLVVPTDFSTYTFRVQDLPMLISVLLAILYFLYLFFLLACAIISNNLRCKTAKTTRTLNPKLGFLGFLGFFGFLGFWDYSFNQKVSSFAFFMFFGFFGFFYEGKMSNTLMDERYLENKARAQLTAMNIGFTILFLTTIILGQGKLLGNLEYTFIATFIILSLTIALVLFLSKYLLYRYDHDAGMEECIDESEE